jgi:RNA polymerase sigma-70 factor, ECF subfamily
VTYALEMGPLLGWWGGLASRALARAEVEDAAKRADRELAARAGSGDRRAFDELYRRHADWVFRRLTRLIGPLPEREDLMQQVFFEAYRALPSFRGDAAFATFLYRIVVNIAYDHLRRRKPDRVGWDDLELSDLVAPGASPETAAREREQLVRVLDCLGRVKPKKRIAFVLRVVEGLSLDEIAVLTGANAPAVGQRVKHAHREICAMLERLARRETP